MRKTILRRIGTVAALALLAASVCAVAVLAPPPARTAAAELPASVGHATVVLSYEDVFRSYYDQAAEDAAARGNAVCAFDEFCDKYYVSGLDLPSYTAAVAAYAEVAPAPRASNDADYILSANDYAVTPASEFVRKPVYTAYDFSVVREGDIVYETDTILFNAGHNALVYDVGKSYADGTYIQTIEAVGGGVQFGFLDDTRIVDFGVKILRVTGASASVIEQAKYFCRAQLGKSYFLNIMRLNTSIDSTSWYCSELVYAAYKYGGIDIGVKKNGAGEDVYLSLGCIPSDIYKSYNTSEVTIGQNTSFYYLELAIVDKSGNDWSIRVTNPSRNNVTFEYNAKMCFKENAQQWTGLSHVKTAQVNAGGSINVIISENLLATTVVFSRLDDGKRFITYAYRLDKNTKTMTVEFLTL